MIPLFVENGIAYVWNAEDWHSIRSKYRICGSLIGTIPSFPRQNDFQGLPMALMTEEAALLVQRGVAELIELPNILEKSSEELKQEVKAVEKSDLVHFGYCDALKRVVESPESKMITMEQSEALRKKKIEQLSQRIDIIVAGKRRKMLSKGMPDIPLDKQALLQEEINKLPPVSPAHMLIHLPREHNILTERKSVMVEDLRHNLLENEGSVRFSIYKDLWEKGYYITSGTKFGSDYLVYPGDPVRFHATYMVRCIYDENKLFHPSEIVTFGRLSVAVNKLAVLAFRNRYGKVEYQTIRWHESAV